MSPQAVDGAIAALGLTRGSTVLETGCGNGEILLRTLHAYPDTRGVGVDLDGDAIAEARRRDSTGRARFEVGDAATVQGRFDAVINVGASHAHGGFPAVLPAIRALGAVALYGEGFWKRPPSPRFLAALGGATADELADLDGARNAIANAGYEIVHEAVADDDDWARYEETLAANAERGGAPETIAYARRIRDRRSLPDGTDTLGFALFVLRR